LVITAFTIGYVIGRLADQLPSHFEEHLLRLIAGGLT
jgi:hypothetical protein